MPILLENAKASSRRVSAPQSYSVWLDFIRGAAALIVFLGHARVIFVGSILATVGLSATSAVPPTRSPQSTMPVEIATNGHMAVIVFFVLSGYLVGGGTIRSIRSGKWSTSHYAIQRLSRLWTVLVPVLLIGFALDVFAMNYFPSSSIYGAPAGQQMISPGFPDQVNVKTLFVNLFFLQGIVGEPFGSNGPLWTLSYEMWFYASFPFLAFASMGGTRPVRRASCIIALIAIAFFVGPKICLYFVIWLMGAALELLPRKLPAQVARIAAGLGGAAFIVLCGALLKFKLNIVASDFIEATAFATLCYVIIHLRDEKRPSIFTRLSSGISGMSYTLYLIHAPLLIFISAVLMPVWRPWPLNISGMIRFGLVTGAVLCCAVGAWWLFERNTPRVRKAMTNALSRLRGSRTKLTPASNAQRR